MLILQKNLPVWWENKRLLYNHTSFSWTNPKYRMSGVPRYTKKNISFKPLFIGQIRKLYKKSAKPVSKRLRGLLHMWWPNSGHISQYWKETWRLLSWIVGSTHYCSTQSLIKAAQTDKQIRPWLDNQLPGKFHGCPWFHEYLWKSYWYNLANWLQ